MYHIKSSFNSFLRSVILPQLTQGTNLYTSLNVSPSYPAIFVRYPFAKSSSNTGCKKIRVQIDIVSINYNEREADLLTDLLINKLEATNKTIKFFNVYDYSDVQNPIISGSGSYLLVSEPKRIDDLINPEVVRNTIELDLEYSL